MKEIKIAIVGCEDSKWKPEQIPKVKKQIRDKLFGLQCPKCKSFDIESVGYKRTHIDSEGGVDSPFWKCRNCGYEAEWGYQEWVIHEPIVLVSGHCPKGGVDIWAEEIADELGIKKEIYPAEVNQWNDRYCYESGHTHMGETVVDYTRKMKGYRSRNIQIAEACDVLYCIVPKRPVLFKQPDPFHSPFEHPFEVQVKTKDIFCIHCNDSGHPTNGGCWTMKYAKKLGKETHLVVIE